MQLFLIKISSQIRFEGDRGLYSVKNTALLVIKHILKTHKWAGGHTVPSRYVLRDVQSECGFIQLCFFTK